MQNRFRLAIYDVLESKGISRDNCINWAHELAEKVNEIYEAAQQSVHRDEKQFCPYCKKVHNLMLACPEYKDFVEWRDRSKLTASRP